MNNENNFYDILRSKFNDKEQPFDEANWKSMRAMIDKSREKKRRIFWLASSAAFLLLAAGTFGVIEWRAGSGKPSLNSSLNSSVNNSSQNTTTVSKQTANPANPAATSDNGTTANNNNNVKTANTEVASTNAVSSNGNNMVAMVNPAQPGKGVTKHKHHGKSGSRNNEVDNEVAAINNEIAAIERDTKVDNVISGSLEIGTSANPTANPPSTKTTSTPAPTQAKPPVNNTPAKADDGIIGTSEPQRMSDEPWIFKGKKQMISIEAGCSWNNGWAMGPNGNPTQGQGFNYLLGVGYTRYLKAHWFLKTGIQFSEFGHMNTYSYNYESVSPQNSNVVNDSVITTKRLYYLTVPVQFEYFVGHKSSIGFGGALSYLFESTSSATAYQQIDNNPPANIQNYSHVQLNGYNKMPVTIYGLYRYTYSHHWSAYFMPYFMTPIENKSFFGENAYLFNAGAKIMLSYTL